MSLIAGIGSRDLPPQHLEICRMLGEWVVRNGHTLTTGGAKGADQSFAAGANSVHPGRVWLFLPWPGFEREQHHVENVVRDLEDLTTGGWDYYSAQAQKHHPAWSRLSQGAQKLQIRNGRIVEPSVGHPVQLVLAWPNWNKPGGGGTGHSLRVAQSLGVEVVDLNGKSHTDLHALCERIRRMP